MLAIRNHGRRDLCCHGRVLLVPGHCTPCFVLLQVVLVNGCSTPAPVEAGNMEIFGLLLTPSRVARYAMFCEQNTFHVGKFSACCQPNLMLHTWIIGTTAQVCWFLPGNNQIRRDSLKVEGTTWVGCRILLNNRGSDYLHFAPNTQRRCQIANCQSPKFGGEEGRPVMCICSGAT